MFNSGHYREADLPVKGSIDGSFPKNVCLVAVDSAHYKVVGDLKMKRFSWCFFFRSESHGLVTLNSAAGG
jgi:hypothetical protein